MDSLHFKQSTIVLTVLFLCFVSVTGQGNNRPLIQGIRLVDGVSENATEVRDGRLEVRYLGVWGTVCKDFFDSKDAGVVCRMLGYEGVAFPQEIGEGRFGPGASGQDIHLDNVECDGDEVTIDDCPYIGTGSPLNNCNHDSDVGVVCLGPMIPTTPTTTASTTTTTLPPTICNNPSNNVRLRDAQDNEVLAVGRVQVRQNGVWGEICDDSWGKEDAAVICRMLCYNPANARALLGGTYGNRTAVNFHLDDVQCNGQESDIFDCPSNPGAHNCAINEAAAVNCLLEPAPPSPVPDPEIDCVTPEDRIVARFSLSAEPRLEESHLSLTDTNVDSQACGVTTSRDNQFVYISIPFIGCGGSRDINFTHIIYGNRITYDVPPESVVITRQEIYEIPVFCLMGRNGDPDEPYEPAGLTVPPQYGDGHPDLKLQLFETSAFVTAIADEPAQITIGAFVNVGVILTTTDPELKLVVNQCYTTPEEDKESTPRYDLVLEKCSQEETLTFYPINDTFFGFSFQAFRFDQEDLDTVYLHCKGIVCDLSEKTGRCDQSCGVTDDTINAGRKRRDISFTSMFSAAQSYVTDLLRSKRQVSPYSGMEVTGDEGPIYIIDPGRINPVRTPPSTDDVTSTTTSTPTSTTSTTTTTTTTTATPDRVVEHISTVPYVGGAPWRPNQEETSHIGTSTSPPTAQQCCLALLVAMLLATLLS